MKFVSTDDLKEGMRLAKPIYNKNGVMLYERDTKLTSQGILMIKNFGLIGIYILEPAEPLPPMTEEDREFERFQTVSVFSLKEILEDIIKGKEPKKLETLATEILKMFGRSEGKISFAQSLRSAEDTVYKHSLNVAILGAAIGMKMDLTNGEKHSIVVAALLHNIGALSIKESLLIKSEKDYSDEDWKYIFKCWDDGYRMLRENCELDSDIMRNISYLLRDLREMKAGPKIADSKKVDKPLEALKVAYMFDNLTAMRYGDEPRSDIGAYKYMRNPVNGLYKDAVNALTKAIHIVPAGCSVEFENGTKGIVLIENEDDVLRPFILSFKDNMIYNLVDGKVYQEYQIKDVLKTLDNRYIMTDKYSEYMSQLSQGQVK